MRGDRALRLILIAAILIASITGAVVGTTSARFVWQTDNAGNSLSAARVFSGTRSTTAYDISDAADGSAANTSPQMAFADGTYYKTKNWTNTWTTARYQQFQFNQPLPAGIALSNAQFNLTFADDDAGATQFCYYVEVRRTSDSSVLATYGSSGTPAGCEVTQTLKTVSTSLPVITDTDVANDITVRVYGMHSGGAKAARIDAATISADMYGVGRTLYADAWIDAADTVVATTGWGLAAAGDGYSYTTNGNWSNAFAAGRYVKATFPSYLGAAAIVTGATIDYAYKAQNAGETACWYMEVYDGATLLATHGSAAAPISCNATTSYVTDTVSIPEVDTADEANDLIVRIYGKNSASKKSISDLLRLNVTSSLGFAGCVSPGDITRYSTRDTFIQIDKPNDNNAIAADIRVKNNQARRVLVYFGLPSTPEDCSLTGARLRMYVNTAQSTRTLDAYRNTSNWVESVGWATAPTSGATKTSLTTSGVGWKEWDVTTQVAEMYAATPYGFMIRDATESGGAAEQRFDSRENTHVPVLILTFG